MSDRKFTTSIILSSLIMIPQISIGACKDFAGEIKLEPDPDCKILTHRARALEFPDVKFMTETGAQNACFKGKLTGSIGKIQVIGNSYSAHTTSPMRITSANAIPFTAASIASLRLANGMKLGNIYLRDSGVYDPNTNMVDEQLVSSGSTGFLFKTRATINVSGNEFVGAPATGTICSPMLSWFNF